VRKTHVRHGVKSCHGSNCTVPTFKANAGTTE
jgi:hypothetical protein